MIKLVQKMVALALGIVGMLGIKTAGALPVYDQQMEEIKKHLALSSSCN